MQDLGINPAFYILLCYTINSWNKPTYNFGEKYVSISSEQKVRIACNCKIAKANAICTLIF